MREYTTMNPSDDFHETLEGYVDKYGLVDVLDALQEIAEAKSLHIFDAWQDAKLSRKWDRASEYIASAAQRIDGLELHLREKRR